MSLTDRLRGVDRHEISWTAAQRFLACPMQEGLLRLGVERAPKRRRDFLVGNVVHECLEIAVNRRYAVTLGEIEAEFFRRANKDGILWKGKDDRDTLRKKAIATVFILQPRVLEIVAAAQDVFTEHEAGTVIGWSRPISFVMTAKVDLLTCTDGLWSAYDYKSSLSSPDAGQLHWYRAVLEPELPKGDSLATVFLSPQPDGSLKERVVAPDPAKVEEYRLLAGTVADALTTGALPAHPAAWTCKECRVRVSCAESVAKAHTGRSVA